MSNNEQYNYLSLEGEGDKKEPLVSGSTLNKDDSSNIFMTIVVKGDEHILDQIQKQLAKLEEVIAIKKCESSSSVQREMSLIKVRAEASNRGTIIETADIYKARIVDVSLESVIIEITGSEEKVESLLRLLEPYGILEYVRTGLTSLDRGSGVM